MLHRKPREGHRRRVGSLRLRNRWSRRHVEGHAVPLRLPGGERAQLCISRDTTERAEAQDALRRSEERLRLVHVATDLADFEAADDGVSVVSDRLLVQAVRWQLATEWCTLAPWSKLIGSERMPLGQGGLTLCLASLTVYEMAFPIEVDVDVHHRDQADNFW